MRLRIEQGLASGAEVFPGPEQAHHLARVRRLGPGDLVEVVDGHGAVWTCRVAEVDPVRLCVEGPSGGADGTPRVDLEIWVPVLKGGRTDALVRSLTEVGALRIVPFVSARGVARPTGQRAESRVARWRDIARESTAQCGRIDVPAIEGITGLPQAGPGVFFGTDHQHPKARTVLTNLAAGGSLRVLTGPEGGLAPEEVEALEALGWQAAWLGPRILRAETAPIVAAALALSALGEGGY